ncbi:hypothetical protein A3754_00670 [Alcanivorax sp. HI0083]|nr:hypothetical protein A3730_01750 [Alcanivorax sp. HI0044]KZZ29785.1 hypothetical protein A3754_00670 [Alcanivorax sp. HI0083]
MITLSGLQHWCWNDAGPFSLDMDAGRLVAEDVLRHLPGKRLVVRGTWQGKSVIAKLFFNDSKAAGRNEYSLLETLAAQGVCVPEALALLEQDNHALLLMEPVLGAGLDELLADGVDLPLLKSLLDTVWGLYKAGWIQTDLHLGNFLVNGDGEVVCLDAGAIKPVPSRGAAALADNLALMCAQATLALQAPLIQECLHFMKHHGVRSRDFEERCQHALHRRMVQADRKSQRNCSAICVESTKDGVVYSDRMDRGATGSWLAYCEKPEALPLLKKGSRISVYANEHWVVKHYREVGLKARLKQKMKCSRGMISWRQGWLWALLGIPTPRPVMLVEFIRGERAGTSVIVFPKLESIALSRLMEQQRSRAQGLAENVRRWLEHFLWAGISHGDMKAQNILVDEADRISFIDLDGAGFSSRARWAQVKNQKDKLRFEKNWEQFQ